MAPGRSALIIATSTYSDPRLATLAGPAKDAAALKGVLGAEDIGGFDVKTLLNARSHSIRETLEAFFSDRARDDLLLVSVSCHGLKDDDGQLFLAASDTKLDRLMSTGSTQLGEPPDGPLSVRTHRAVPRLLLRRCLQLGDDPARGRRDGGGQGPVHRARNGRHHGIGRHAVLVRRRATGGRASGAVAIHAGARGWPRTGEADRNEDGQVSINELFDFLEDRVRETSPSQTPTKSAVNKTGDWVIARSTRVPSVKLLPERVQLC